MEQAIKNLMKEKFLVISVVVLMLGSCSPNKESYFDFDQVDYYSIKKDNKEFRERYDCNTGVESEDFGCDIVNSYRPTSIGDTTFIDSLVHLNYSKTELDSAKFDDLRLIFSVTDPPFVNTYNACAPIYRDILIFKKRNKITGMAKICFECEQHYIVGSNIPRVESFDFAGLGNILY